MRRGACIIVAWVLGLGFVAVGGCSSKPQVDEKKDSGTKTDPSTNPTQEAVNVVHELDPAKHVVPNAMISGTLAGSPFSPEVLVEGDYLVLRTTKEGQSFPDREIRLRLSPSASVHPFENRKLTIRQDLPEGPEVPDVLVDAGKGNLRLFPNGYAMTLELGTRQGWKIPGKIYLCLPDAEKTVLAGAFVAAYPRQPTEPPGTEDLPYIKGTVNVIGTPPKAVLRVGYAASPNPELFALGSADIELGEPVNPIRWAKSDHDKPRVTTLIAGDGKTIPSRFEHTRLTTGRYLVFATLEPEGPAAWKWVTILPGQAQTVDLTIDTRQTGGVEIGVPLEAVKTVQMVPADTAGFNPPDSTMFIGCTWQLSLERLIIARKAIYKNLSPGRYEVRAAGQTRFVDIVAGKTAELDFERTLQAPMKEAAPEPRPKP